MNDEDFRVGMIALRKPFAEGDISKLPKPTRAQTDAVKQNFKAGVRCDQCGGWHHPGVVHLDYVGHAAVTKRLLDVDPSWYWEPLSMTENGQPVFDNHGGLWIKLSILGKIRLGYGAAEGKIGPDAIKEVIGDAIRNGAMRFGVALELWHKGDFAQDEADESKAVASDYYPEKNFNENLPAWASTIIEGTNTAESVLAFLGSKGLKLSPSQIKTIQNIGKE